MHMLLAENVAREPETAADIQIMNKEFAAVMRNLQRNIRVLAETVNRQDRTRLVAHYQRIQEQLSRDPELARKAFERASEAISPVSER